MIVEDDELSISTIIEEILKEAAREENAFNLEGYPKKYRHQPNPVYTYAY